MTFNNLVVSLIAASGLSVGAVSLTADQLSDLQFKGIEKCLEIQTTFDKQLIDSARVAYQMDHGTLDIPSIDTLIAEDYLQKDYRDRKQVTPITTTTGDPDVPH